MTQEALKLALEALGNSWTEPGTLQYEIEQEAITAIKEALAQTQEPVGKFAKFTDGIWRPVTDYSAGVFLYTTPPQRTWVGLTDEEICMFSMWLDSKPDATVFTAIEARLKELNT
jgi:hypothetical protein